jgi:2-octaprenyl-6-methoxyphenol hydroxylase|tara:strand:- start:5640 stop:6758 length:1119 start_codon:yes stop_codon:yes gene_type:complete
MREKVCIIGDGITALMLSKALLDLDIKVDLITKNNFKTKIQDSRTIGISDSNLFFLKNHGIIDKKTKIFWKINQIKIFNSKLKLNKNLLLNFENKEKNSIFHMVKNDAIHLSLKKKIQKNSLLTIIKKNNSYLLSKQFSKKNYKLIINCSSANSVDKKFFFKKINKNYKATAHTTIVKHEKIKNHIAYQFFTNYGPMAFLPISGNATSIVWSVSNKNNISDKIFVENIKKLFPSSVKKISFLSINKFKLNFLLPREYYFENILNFGDGLHKIHPIAGQGLNMTIRDIKILKSIIQKKINLGLELDSSVLKDFDSKVKSYNFIFAKGIDFTEEYFSINNNFFNFYSNKLFNKINKNIFIKSLFMKFANKGLGI